MSALTARNPTTNTVSRARHGDEVPLGSGAVGAERPGVHRERDAFGMADGRREQRHRVADGASHRRDRPAPGIRSAHPMRRPDELELVPEPRHEPERGECRVADAVRHPQVLHHRAHEIGARSW